MVSREFDIVAKLATVFAEAGRQLYLVGGVVRDALLGRTTNDLDLATDAEPREIKRLVAKCHPDAVFGVGEKFGTIGLAFGDCKVEVTTYRAEWYAPDSRKPEVRFGNSLDADLARRDFTINAIAQDPITGEIVDPFRGVRDLRDGVVRAVGTPVERFAEDPLRLLRAVRFASQLGFEIERETWMAIVATGDRLSSVSNERILDELNRIVSSPDAGRGIRLLSNGGLLALTVPEVEALRGISDEDRRHKDVFEHTLSVVDNIAPVLHLRWAALLHDIGKPATRTFDNQTVHFYDHDCVGADLSRKLLVRLRLDSRSVSKIVKLVRYHMRTNTYDPTWTDSAVRRLIREVGPELDDLIALSRADVTSRRPQRVAAVIARVNELEQRCQELLAREQVAELTSPLDGNQLMEMFKKPPGPWIKRVKDHLLAQVLDGQLGGEDKERAAQMACEFVEKEGL